MSPEDRTYRDSDDRPCDLPTLCMREPQWACSRIIKLAEERDAYRKAKAENDERFMSERDDAREKLRALVEAVVAAEGAYDALDDLVYKSSKAIHNSTMWEAEESLGWQEHRNEWYPKMAALKAALKAARGAL